MLVLHDVSDIPNKNVLVGGVNRWYLERITTRGRYDGITCVIVLSVAGLNQPPHNCVLPVLKGIFFD